MLREGAIRSLDATRVLGRTGLGEDPGTIPPLMISMYIRGTNQDEMGVSK